MSSKIKKYFIFALAVILAIAFTFTGVVSFQSDTSAYAAEPTEPATDDGSPDKPCPDPDNKGKAKAKCKRKGKK